MAIAKFFALHANAITTEKLYFHIDSGTSTDQIFPLLDILQSDNEDEINKIDE